jgi:polysaccharide pyruvyl transferase WcaK-like protein
LNKLKILVAGPYGAKNQGDEAILSSIAATLRDEGHSVIATSFDPAHTLQSHGLPSVPFLNLRKGHVDALRELSRVDCLVIGGGEQFAEGRMRSPLWGLLPSAAFLIRRASALNKPSMVWAVGVNTLSTWHSKWYVSHWISKASAVTVRDSDSRERLALAGMPLEHISLAADPVLKMRRADRRQSRIRLRELLQLPAEQDILLICPANDRLGTLSFAYPMMEGVQKVASQHQAAVVVLPMDPRPQFDAVFQSHPAFASAQSLHWLSKELFDEDFLSMVFAGSDLVIGSRMHALIMACAQGTPWVPIARSPKIVSFSREFEKPFLTLHDLSASQVAKFIEDQLSCDRAQWLNHNDSNLARLTHRVDVSLERFNSMLSSIARPMHRDLSASAAG